MKSQVIHNMNGDRHACDVKLWWAGAMLIAARLFYRPDTVRWFNIAGNNNLYSGLHAKCPIFSSDFKQTWTLSTDFHESCQYQISRKSVQRELCWHLWTNGRMDGRVEVNSRFWRLLGRCLRGDSRQITLNTSLPARSIRHSNSLSLQATSCLRVLLQMCSSDPGRLPRRLRKAAGAHRNALGVSKAHRLDLQASLSPTSLHLPISSSHRNSAASKCPESLRFKFRSV